MRSSWEDSWLSKHVRVPGFRMTCWVGTHNIRPVEVQTNAGRQTHQVQEDWFVVAQACVTASPAAASLVIAE